MKVKSESEIMQSCLTLSNLVDCSLPGSSVHGISRQEYWSGVPLPSPLLCTTSGLFYIFMHMVNYIILISEHIFKSVSMNPIIFMKSYILKHVYIDILGELISGLG